MIKKNSKKYIPSDHKKKNIQRISSKKGIDPIRSKLSQIALRSIRSTIWADPKWHALVKNMKQKPIYLIGVWAKGVGVGSFNFFFLIFGPIKKFLSGINLTYKTNYLTASKNSVKRTALYIAPGQQILLAQNWCGNFSIFDKAFTTPLNFQNLLNQSFRKFKNCLTIIIEIY